MTRESKFVSIVEVVNAVKIVSRINVIVTTLRHLENFVIAEYFLDATLHAPRHKNNFKRPCDILKETTTELKDEREEEKKGEEEKEEKEED